MHWLTTLHLASCIGNISIMYIHIDIYRVRYYIVSIMTIWPNYIAMSMAGSYVRFLGIQISMHIYLTLRNVTYHTKNMTGVGFEPTPFRTAALTRRLRPLGHPANNIDLSSSSWYNRNIIDMLYQKRSSYIVSSIKLYCRKRASYMLLYSEPKKSSTNMRMIWRKWYYWVVMSSRV